MTIAADHGPGAEPLPTWAPAVSLAAVEELVAQLAAQGIDVVREQPMARLTTLGVGGSAAALVEAADAPALTVVLAAINDLDVPLLVLGRGSNVLVADSGWPGLVLRLGAGFKQYRRDAAPAGAEGTSVLAGGGAAMPALAAWLAAEGLTGLEFAAGIPATVGGSVRMNAGAHGGQTGDLIRRVRVATPERPEGYDLAPHELGLGYRRTSLPARAVVVEAEWTLQAGDPAQLRATLDELRAWRRATQPLRQRSCGSVFTNPPGESAGRLVEAAGLKGLQVGGAAVSDKHANFIVTSPGARARDVAELIAVVRDRVHAGGGPLLEPEVRLVGDVWRESR